MSLNIRSISILLVFYTTIIFNSFAVDIFSKKNKGTSESAHLSEPLSTLATTNTSASGNWSLGTNWTAGVPGSGDIVSVNHTMNLDVNITLAGGGYYTVKSPVTDATGGTAYTLTLNGSNSHGVLDVYSNMTFEGACNVNSKGQIIVRNGATLTLGPTTFANGSFVTVEAGGTLIINGSLTNNNNSNNITVNGNVIVNGNFSGGNGSTVVGSGGLTTTGTITNTGGTVFGSGNSCSPGPCSGTNLCNFTNTITADQSICYSQTPSSLTGSAVASATYTWQSCTTSATGTYTTAAGTSNGQNYSPGALTTTTWFRRKVVSGTCTSISTPVQISVTNFPVSVSIASSFGGTSICTGSSVIFTAAVTNGGTSPSYQWKLNNVNVGSNNPTYSSSTLSNNDVISCVVTSSLPSCTAGNPATSNSLTMSVSGTAPAAPTAIGGSVCGSGSVTFITAGSGGTIRNWYSTSSGGSLIATGSTYTTPNLSTTTTYYVATQSNTGCEGPRTAVVATVNPLPTPSISSSTGSFAMCSGFALILSSSSASSYLWSTGATTSSITVSTAGTFTVTVKDANGCRGSSSVTTTVNPLPAVPTISASGATTFCSGGSVNLNSSSATSYLWSTGATTQTITANTSGSYTVTIADANGCKRSSLATVVTANPLPATPTINASGSTSLCTGGSVTLTSSSSTNGYSWSNSATTQAITVNSSGSYTVTVKDLNNCTATSAPTVVTVNPLPETPTITAGGPTTFCSGGSVTLTSSSSNNGYSWSNSAITQAISVNTSGSYSVTVSDINNCTATSAPIVVTVNPLPSTPTISASGPTTFCAGNSVNLSSSAATSYLWSTGETTQTISVSSSGSFSVTITDANGCNSSSLAINVTVNSLPSIPTITAGGPTSFCSGDSVTLNSSSSYSYFLWSIGATTPSIMVKTTGIYSVTVSDANGCQASSTPLTVTIIPCNFTWTGAANNNDWNTPGNWANGKVPTSLDNVTIPAVTSSPIITSSISYNTITINTGATFTVNNGATLITIGDFTNNGTYTDNGGTINFSGTTVQNINGTVNLKNVTINNSTGVNLNGPTTIAGILTLTNGPLVSNGKLNLVLTSGAINYNSSDNGSISGNMMVTKKVPSIKTHYISSPLTGSTTGDFYDDVQVINPSTSLTRLFSWDVPTQAWIGMYGTGTALSPLVGYSIYYPTVTASSVLDFTGTYSHKAVNTPVTYSNVTLNGYVLVGNPYPATLDWNNSNGWVKTNIYDGIYFWDAAHGQYASYVNGASTNNGTQYVPSMQAFYVVSSVAGDVTIGVNNSARLTNPNPSMWRYATKSNILKLTLTSGSYSDETVIGFNESAGDHFDGSFDAFKLKNPDLVPSIYTTLGNTDYSINTLATGSDKIIPLNLETGFSGTYTISNEEVAPFHGNYSVILEDKSLNTFTDLKSQNYSFNINPGEGKNKFNLIYKNSESAINNLISDASVIITGDGKEVKVKYNNLINSEANFSIYNSIGQLIYSNNFNTTSGTYVYDSSNAVTGVYIIKVIADGKVYSSKVYINE